MRYYRLIKAYIVPSLVSIAALLCVLQQVSAAEPPVVNSIELRGLSRVSEGAVRGNISQNTGEPLSTEAVSADIKAIYGLGYFKDVRVEAEPFEGGLKLIYVVSEKPAIRRVGVFGNEELDETKIYEKITASSGSIANEVLIKDNAEAIRELYEREGYPLTSVVPIVSELDDSNVYLTYLIEEGPKVKINEIRIEGNDQISDDEIEDAMESSEWWFLSWLTGGGRYEREKLAEDVEKIKKLYQDRGFIQVRVFEPSVKFLKGKEWLDIDVDVREGQKFTVASVDFYGNTVLGEEELRDNIKATPGGPVSRKVLSRDVATMTDMLTERGHALASVYPDLSPDEETATAGVVFKFDEGEVFDIGRIEITGNTKTRDKVIRREIRLDEGQRYNSKLLRRSYQRVSNLNFFEEVKVNPVPDVEHKKIDLDVHVKEKSTGMLNVGGGYSTVDRFIGMVDLTQGNLWGRGQTLKFRSEFGSKSTLYEITFKEPWLLDTPVSLDLSVYNSEKEYPEYDKKSQGFSLGLGRSLGEYWRVGAAYSFEDAEITHISDNATIVIKEQEGTRTTSSIAPFVTRDTRDNYLDPHTGTRTSLGLSYAGLGGDNRFFKTNLDASVHLPVTETTTFSIRGRYGYATGVSGEKLPLYERYYVGSVYTVRGLRDLGPKDDNGIYIGGTKRLIFNADYSFPLAGEAGLKGALFVDTGTAYDSSITMRYTMGAGIKWLSPIGPLRLDWAYNPDKKAGEPKYRWEFAIGTLF